MPSFSITDNEQSVKWLLQSFIQSYEYYRKLDGENFLPCKVVDGFVKNEMDMERGMKEHYEWCNEVERRNQRLLRAIKSVKGKAFYKHLCELLKSCECPYDGTPLELIPSPDGDFQKENDWGREIKGYWCNQWAVGDSGDSYTGYICVKIRENKYLKAHFSM